MKTAGIVHLPSVGFILTIFTGYKGNPGELVSGRAKKLHPQSVIDLRSKRKRTYPQTSFLLVPESAGNSPTRKPAMAHIYFWIPQYS
jgi:hypothetical protein